MSFNMSAENRTLFYQYQIQQSRFDEVAFYFLPGTYKLQFEFLEDKAKFYNHEVEFTVDRDSKEVSFFCNPEGCVRH
ncbi:hypothetical protein EHO98_01120 [Leptospira stimsonii]|uniref:Uncharacterized protein n=1 Tax=Leptospira stimsonii TaxID=2202203 RepID=A0ABY2NF58_9LEPT|nr:hypothetical protein EHO98_01120 [Leptospira stimsonii]TGM22416.1 hypothetical protein EHQ90_00450 [Leptospira stimsonii]